jgi:hypothetical protein
MIGDPNNNFHSTWNFNPEKGGSRGYSEVTGGYRGSRDGLHSPGMTIGFQHRTGDIYFNTEEHYGEGARHGDHKLLCG